MLPNYDHRRNRPKIPPPPPNQASPRENYRWLIWPTVALVVLLPIAIVSGARTADLPGLLLAYLNVLIIITAMIYFLSRRTFEDVLPVVFLIWPLMSFPLATIYFGLSNPDVWYVTTLDHHRPLLGNNFRVQSVMLLFVTSYIFTVLLVRPRGSKLPTFSVQNRATKRLVYVVACAAMISFAGGLYARIAENYGSGLGYVLAGLFNYLFAIPIIFGVLFPKIPKTAKIGVLTFFGVTSPAYLLYHSRLNLVGPWVMMAFGLLLFSEWPRRKKITLALVSLFAFPLLMIIGEVTRGMKASVSMQERTETMGGRWQDVFANSSFIGSTMSRFFSTGGHSIITMSPEEVPYLEFDPVRYFGEMAISAVVPGRIWADYFYSTTYHLNGYGLRVTTSTSVELSLPGSLWMLGGWIPIFLGGIWVGLLDGCLMHWLRSATRKSSYQGLFYLAMIIGTVLWSFNWDPITLTRGLLRNAFFAWLLWNLVVRPYLGPQAMTRVARQPQSYPLMPERLRHQRVVGR